MGVRSLPTKTHRAVRCGIRAGRCFYVHGMVSMPGRIICQKIKKLFALNLQIKIFCKINLPKNYLAGFLIWRLISGEQKIAKNNLGFSALRQVLGRF